MDGVELVQPLGSTYMKVGNLSTMRSPQSQYHMLVSCQYLIRFRLLGCVLCRTKCCCLLTGTNLVPLNAKRSQYHSFIPKVSGNNITGDNVCFSSGFAADSVNWCIFNQIYQWPASNLAIQPPHRFELVVQPEESAPFYPAKSIPRSPLSSCKFLHELQAFNLRRYSHCM
jgi:hypothetical protein